MGNGNKVNIGSRKSDLLGIKGVLETFVRKFRVLSFLFLLSPIAFIYILAIGISLWPGALLTTWVYQNTGDFFLPWRVLCLSCSVATSYLLYGITLLFVVPIFNWPFIHFIKPWRGNWYSLKSIPWYIHNALTQLVRYTFIDLCTPSPLTTLFYKMMGMKLGKGVLINTSNISDPCLITMGDYVTVGGSATVFGHYGQKGFLVLARTEIKARVTLGLKCSVMGDVIIEEKVVVPPHTVLLPKSRVDKTTIF